MIVYALLIATLRYIVSMCLSEMVPHGSSASYLRLRRLRTESGRSSLRWTITAQIDEHNLRRDTGGQSEHRGGQKE
ncbi:hypothetical protein C8Q74DRAFT_110890 [Fomes fomentarius]|nr:hypothetical protein C8Q74DRAFT_110890 [Fomes fomentarius]